MFSRFSTNSTSRSCFSKWCYTWRVRVRRNTCIRTTAPIKQLHVLGTATPALCARTNAYLLSGARCGVQHACSVEFPPSHFTMISSFRSKGGATETGKTCFHQSGRKSRSSALRSVCGLSSWWCRCLEVSRSRHLGAGQGPASHLYLTVGRAGVLKTLNGDIAVPIRPSNWLAAIPVDTMARSSGPRRLRGAT